MSLYNTEKIGEFFTLLARLSSISSLFIISLNNFNIIEKAIRLF